MNTGTTRRVAGPENGPDERNPAVTFALFAYQQERFVGQAVQGALDQTYTPLQIILSDDCSSDRTFNIMRDMVAGYAGPHRIVLNRTATNQGIGEHVNQVMALASGELIIAAAGDDVSAPERASALVNAWFEHGKPSMLLSRYNLIDEDGKVLGDGPGPSTTDRFGATGSNGGKLLRFLSNWDLAIAGATEAWTPMLFRTFGPLARDLVYEDDVLAFRALLADGLVFLPDRLINYRQHDSNVSSRKWWGDRGVDVYRRREFDLQTIAVYRLGALRSHERDIATATTLGLLPDALAAALQACVTEQTEIEGRLSIWWSAAFPERLRWYMTHLHRHSARVPFARWALMRLLPLDVFVRLASSAGRLRSAIRPYAKPVKDRLAAMRRRSIQ